MSDISQWGTSMRLLHKTATAGAAVACRTALLAPGAAASAVGEHSTSAAPADVKIMSNDEYVEEFGAQRALAEGVPLPSDNADPAADNADPAAAPPDPSFPW
jgi:hypothetical protein